MLTVLVRTEGDQFTRANQDDLPRLLAIPGGLVWADLEEPTEDEVRVLSDVFRFHPLTIDDCLNTYVDPPKVDDYGDYLFLITQGLDFRASTTTIVTTELDLYIGRSYLVSFHHRPLVAVDETRSRCERAAPVPARGPDWLAHALLDAVVDQLLPVVQKMDEQLADLEDEVLAGTRPELTERLTAMKRSALRLRRLVAPQRDVINRLSRGDFVHLIGEDTSMYFRDIYDHLVRLDDIVEGLRDLGDSVVSTYLATASNRMNEIMKWLSVVGTILLPLTLVASIFGTNFSPTYEEWGWPGFLAMCAVMLAGTAAGVWWFRRRGWF